MFFISLFIPALIAVIIYSKIQNKKIDLTYFVIWYPIYLFGINYIIIFILVFLFEGANTVLVSEMFSNILSLKYMSLAIVLAVILPLAFSTIKINISFKKVKNHEK
ncbi:MAG: hypothetical protein GX861_00140 [Tenericutes bacterium]|nr:hypothetical protein [Mycoplasmatota bacterium]